MTILELDSMLWILMYDICASYMVDNFARKPNIILVHVKSIPFIIPQACMGCFYYRPTMLHTSVVSFCACRGVAAQRCLSGQKRNLKLCCCRVCLAAACSTQKSMHRRRLALHISTLCSEVGWSTCYCYLLVHFCW